MSEIKKFYNQYGYYLPINFLDKNKVNFASKRLINIYKKPSKNIKHPWNL